MSNFANVASFSFTFSSSISSFNFDACVIVLSLYLIFLESKMLLIPRYPSLGNAEVKLLAGTISLDGKSPSSFVFLIVLDDEFRS